VIEGKIPWEVLRKHGNFVPASLADAEMELGFGWVIVDADGVEGFGGQIQCMSLAQKISEYAEWVFTTTLIGKENDTR
jgi:hypothetical protein